jgi:hypothetical protein
MILKQKSQHITGTIPLIWGQRFETRSDGFIVSIYLILPGALGPGVYSRSRKIMFLGSRARPVHEADNLTDICELTF